MKSNVGKFFIGWVTGVILGCLLFGIQKCSAQTKQDVLRELHRQKVPHANIVLAQARLESGNFKSDFYRKTNNLFGLKKGKKYTIYKHWRDSIKDYKLRISSRYQGGSYYAFLTKIGYAENKDYIKLLKEINK
jgi:uncharacterized FlgJ-related protein